MAEVGMPSDRRSFPIEGLVGETPLSMLAFAQAAVELMVSIPVEVQFGGEAELTRAQETGISVLMNSYQLALAGVNEDPKCEGLCRQMANSYGDQPAIQFAAQLVRPNSSIDNRLN